MDNGRRMDMAKLGRCCCGFILALEDNFYQLLPYEAIDEEEYNRRKKEMKPFIPSLISKYEEHEVNLTAGGGNGCNCDNGICPVR